MLSHHVSLFFPFVALRALSEFFDFIDEDVEVEVCGWRKDNGAFLCMQVSRCTKNLFES